MSDSKQPKTELNESLVSVCIEHDINEEEEMKLQRMVLLDVILGRATEDPYCSSCTDEAFVRTVREFFEGEPQKGQLFGGNCCFKLYSWNR